MPTPKPVTPKPVTPKPAKVVVAEKKAEDKKNGSFSIEDKPEFKKLLSSSSPAMTQMSPIVPDGDPPEPEDLIKAIQVNKKMESSKENAKKLGTPDMPNDRYTFSFLLNPHALRDLPQILSIFL